ncbi:MAG: hypothetical protein WBO28_03655 [Flavobacteriales bacterium]|jgi:hypothetical protein
MSDKKGHERMQELTDSLSRAMGRLQEGKLGLEDLEQATTDARLLFERLVVLRHKLREAAVGHAQKGPVQNGTSQVAEAVMAPLRLDTRPSEPPVHQTSLIDAIAETESIVPAPKKAEKPKAEKPVQPKAVPAEKPAEPKAEIAAEPVKAEKPQKSEEPVAEAEITEAPKAEKPKAEEPKTKEPVAEKPKAEEPKVEEPKAQVPKAPTLNTVKAAEERPVTVADKLEQAPVADLRKAIALSQKFWFVAELFSGERDRYEKSIDALNGMDGLTSANTYLENEVLAKLSKQPGEVADTFRELLKRRFRA